MAKLYYNKIKNAEINSQTGKPWSLEDVPSLWYAEVSALIAETPS